MDARIASGVNKIPWAGYVKNPREKILVGVKDVDVIGADNAKSRIDLNKELTDCTFESWKEKKMYGHFIREMPETSNKEHSW